MTLEICAVVPVKTLRLAKTRLGSKLGPALRSRLARAMLQDVLGVLSVASRLSRVMVVTADPEAAAIAQAFGADVMREDSDTSHTEVIAGASRRLAADGWGGMLTLPGDVPLVTASEIDGLIARHSPAPAFTVVPSHDRRGTNAVLCSPPAAVPLSFGDDSFYPHLAVARMAGIEPVVAELQGLALDIDRPEDLARMLGRPGADRTKAALAGWRPDADRRETVGSGVGE